MILNLQILLIFEPVNLKSVEKNKNFYELNRKLGVARQNGSVFIQTPKLTKKN